MSHYNKNAMTSEQILKPEREKFQITYKGNFIIIISDLSIETPKSQESKE
jgi:hypothetical protein